MNKIIEDGKLMTKLISKYPEMKKFKMEDLMDNVFFKVDCTALSPSSVRCLLYACGDPDISEFTSKGCKLGYVIAAYESSRILKQNFSITSVPNIGPARASKLLQSLYDLSGGQYDPESELRLKIDDKYRILKNKLLIETKVTGSSSIEYKRLIRILDEVYGYADYYYTQNGGKEE